MNVFYAEPGKVTEHQFELSGQEARHATKVLRLGRGDEIHATDGKGNRYTGTVEHLSRDSVTAVITQKEEKPKPETELVLAMGIIKKRDRLEFAVEKAVELGASEIVLFTSDHSEKSNVREDRLENIVLSAMKQSMRVWLPKISVFDSLDKVISVFSDHELMMAHEKAEGAANLEKGTSKTGGNTSNRKLLLVGPEGGFSEREVELTTEENGELVSLGKYRLRAETAVVAFLSRFI